MLSFCLSGPSRINTAFGCFLIRRFHVVLLKSYSEWYQQTPEYFFVFTSLAMERAPRTFIIVHEGRFNIEFYVQFLSSKRSSSIFPLYDTGRLVVISLIFISLLTP